jgi:hypothetical protein
MAAEMLEEAIQPHQEEIEKYQRLGMANPCMLYLLGVLKGIYRFDLEGKSEFKGWATDQPAETFSFLLEEWREDSGKENRMLMKDYITKECPEWADWAVKILT